mmetsp:Transcript_38422/g.58504  ORF Transcript_38422/g.58504 Transcript_38422/m.58504 type:complete len:141 (+) Transcript_38422:735-1157(+)
MPKSNCFSAPELKTKKKKGAKNRYQCDSVASKCEYETTSPLEHTFKLKCECGLNPHGHSYCPRKFEKGYTRTLANVTEMFAKECHTTTRLDPARCYYPTALAKLAAAKETGSNTEKVEEDVEYMQSFIKMMYERDHLAWI